MKATKQKIASLEKCYALGKFSYDGKEHIAIAAEKRNPCYTFDLDGHLIDKLWDGPGGVMTLTQVPGQPVLLATRKFYSPNDSAEASIVYCRREGEEWKLETLCKLPFVHRFGILESDGKRYLIACTIKSAHAFKDDWTCPGRVWVAPLPEAVTQFSEEHPLKMTPLLSGLTKNHGFEICGEGNHTFAVIAAENGVIQIIPPTGENTDWSTKMLLDTPASDILYLDFDGDGERELLVLSPFHGDTLTIYKVIDGKMQPVYRHEKALPFLHAIWGEEIEGRTFAFIGCRQGDRDLLVLHFDPQQKKYVYDLLDMGAGAANALYCNHNGKHLLFVTNRETDEIDVYTLEV